MTLKILYEDNHLIVAIKPSGILSQEDSSHDDDMLTLLKKYIKNKYNKPGNVYLGLVHRLDRMTSGVMVFAKTSKAAARLNEQITKGEFTKKYYAVVNGVIENSGRLINYLYKDESEVKSYVTKEGKGKIAILDYKVVKHVNNNTLVDVDLITGRHHQIRVQFSYINHPLVGDVLYGASKHKLMLSAYYLSFNHPITKEKMKFTEIPDTDEWNEYFK